jgi:hypothetical protein
VSWGLEAQIKELRAENEKQAAFIERLKRQLRVSGREAFKAGYKRGRAEENYAMHFDPDKAWQDYSEKVA